MYILCCLSYNKINFNEVYQAIIKFWVSGICLCNDYCNYKTSLFFVYFTSLMITWLGQNMLLFYRRQCYYCYKKYLLDFIHCYIINTELICTCCLWNAEWCSTQTEKQDPIITAFRCHHSLLLVETKWYDYLQCYMVDWALTNLQFEFTCHWIH